MKLSSITQRFISDFQQRSYEFACSGNFTHVLCLMAPRVAEAHKNSKTPLSRCRKERNNA